MSKSISGKCLCGSVTLEVDGLKPTIGVCHCSMCRNWSGGPFIAVEPTSQVKFKGEESISRFNSSQWAERGFCISCGTHLFYHLKANNEYVLLAGLFNDVEGFVLDHQIFIDEKPAYYNFKEQTKCMTGAEVFAQYSEDSEP
jgi:hypothetical protein